MSIPCVAIDGPAGVGKGTVSQRLARLTGWNYLNSGALYRVLAIQALGDGVSLEDGAALARLADQLNVRFAIDESGGTVELAGDEISAELVTEATGEAASRIAPVQEVRAALLDRQRQFLQPPGLVAEGRDMGSVVFPEAELKIFLDASAEERAQRRHKQLKDNGMSGSLRAVLAEIRARDRRDRERSVSPLIPAEDAVIIDTTELSVDQVMEQILELGGERELFST